jgi:plasmid stabilization system protein ParE
VARFFLGKIVERASLVSGMPEIGRVVPELGEDAIREVFIYSYRLIYQIFPDRVAVLVIVHGHRDLHSDDISVVR